MLAQTCRVRLSVRVPRGGSTDVESGVGDVVAAVDGVERAEVESLEGVRPDALDLHVDAVVTVGFSEAVPAPASHLREGFGVTDVEEP